MPRYSLRALLIIAAIGAVPVAHFTHRIRTAQRQRELRQSHVGSFRLWTQWEMLVWEYRYSKEGPDLPAPAWMFNRLGEDFYYPIIGGFGSGPQITDDSLHQLDECTEIENLHLHDTKVTAPGVARFQESHRKCHVQLTYDEDMSQSFKSLEPPVVYKAEDFQ